MSHLSRAIRRFNRFEIKHLITLKQAERIMDAPRAYLARDENAQDDGRYRLASPYYDSPDLRCFWEKMDGVKFRRKLRIRRYETAETLNSATPVFVEIKQRLDRVTQKRRVILPYGDALKLCTERRRPDHTPDDSAVVDEVHAYLWQYNLLPASIVRYTRQAFVGTDYDIGPRVTFDTQLTFQTQPLDLAETPSGLAMFPPEMAVMEIKANERIPAWLTELVAAHNLTRGEQPRIYKPMSLAFKRHSPILLALALAIAFFTLVVGDQDEITQLPLMIQFDRHVPGQSYAGYTAIAIRTGGTTADPAMLQKPLTNAAYRLAGQPAPLTAYTGLAFIRFLNESDDATFAEELPDRLDADAFATYLAVNSCW